MSFSLSLPWILLGLGVLAGALYLLQRLRVRHREVQVVTTLFWRQAVEETRARVLVKRFRHLPAYLLLLLIGSLLWLGFANPASSSTGGTRHVLLLDGSAAMAEGTRFADAKTRMLDDVGGLPAATRTVLLCAGSVRTLLAPGEDALLLEKRLEGVVPQAAPSSVARAARSVAAEEGAALHLHVYSTTASDPGLVALGVSPAASGRWDAVDVLASVGRARESVTSAPASATLDGTALPAPEAPGLWRDVPARGGRLVVRSGSAQGELVLPRRPIVRVRVQPQLAALFTPIFEADPGIEVVDTMADVHVRRGSTETLDPRMPTLNFGPADDRTIEIESPGPADSAALAAAAKALALAEIDGAALAEALGRPVTVGGWDTTELGSRNVLIDEGVLDPAVGFLQSRAFPLVVVGAVRWLAQVEALQPYVAAGEALLGPTEPAVLSPDPVGVAYTPPVAGDVRLGDVQTLHASVLLDPHARTVEADEVAPVLAAGGSAPWRFLAIAAFLLLLLEWFLVRRGRMP